MRIGVDLGGTKIEAAALGRDGRVLARHRVATPAGDYDATLAAVRELVTCIEVATGRQGTVGVGMPGALSPATGPTRRCPGRAMPSARDRLATAASEAASRASFPAPGWPSTIVRQLARQPMRRASPSAPRRAILAPRPASSATRTGSPVPSPPS